jgi:hypothetical protein
VRDRRALLVYGVWLAIAALLGFAHGSNEDNSTRGLILAFFLLQLAAIRPLRSALQRFAPAPRFIGLSVLSGLVVEGCYMVSRPIDASLLVSSSTPPIRALELYLIDITLAGPAYVVIFWFMWRLLGRFRYELWELVILMGAGQALGDGSAYFTQAPWMLLFLPVLMTNYHAMQVVPFLLVEREASGSDRSWMRIAVPLLGLPLIYVVLGFGVKLLGAAIGLIPAR